MLKLQGCAVGPAQSSGPGGSLEAQVTNLALITNIQAVVITEHRSSIVGGTVKSLDANSITLESGGRIRTFVRSNLVSLSLTTNILQPKLPASTAAVGNSNQVSPPVALTNLTTNQPISQWLRDLRSPEGQRLVQEYFRTVLAQGTALGMTPEQGTDLQNHLLTTVSGLTDGSVSLGDLRNQAAQVLEQLKEHRQEMLNDPNYPTWSQYEQTLQEFVRRYDAGER